MKSLRDYQAGLNKRGNTAKGNAFEQEIGDDLRARGYTVDVTELNRSIKRGRWVTKKGDFFTSIDILALKSVGPTLFIQATTDRGGIREKMRKIDETLPEIDNGTREYLVVTRPLKSENGGQGFEVWRRIVSGWIKIEGLILTLDNCWGIS